MYRSSLSNIKSSAVLFLAHQIWLFSSILAVNGFKTYDIMENSMPIPNKDAEIFSSTINTTSNEEESGNMTQVISSVVGGRYASFGGYPFYASILVFNKKTGQWEHICGGALIDKNWVLTAAHCIVQGFEYAVEIGRYAYNGGNGGQYMDYRKAEILCTNPKFDTQRVAEDFGLIYFKKPSIIAPAKLDTGKVLYRDYYPFVILGFGSTGSSGNGPFPEFLQQGDVYYVDRKFCASEWNEVIDDSVMCSSSFGSGDSCKGDSGGPLVVNDGSEFQDYLAGIVSFGPVPCDASVPVLYGRVAGAKKWIDEVIESAGRSNKCSPPITYARRNLRKKLDIFKQWRQSSNNFDSQNLVEFYYNN